MRKSTNGVALLTLLAIVGWGFRGNSGARADDGPDPVFEKPEPVAMAELARRTTQGVSALEVNDYAPGRYTGPLLLVRRTPT